MSKLEDRLLELVNKFFINNYRRGLLLIEKPSNYYDVMFNNTTSIIFRIVNNKIIVDNITKDYKLLCDCIEEINKNWEYETERQRLISEKLNRISNKVSCI